jgi:general secretion pathway protein G
MQKRHAFTLVEVLIVIIIIGILAAAIIPQFTSAADDGRANSTAIVVRAMSRKVAAEYAQDGSYPATLTADMFEGNQLPRNPLFPSVTDPDVDTTNGGAADYHPTTKTSADSTVWWYNPTNGVCRALVPASLPDDAAKIAKYNDVNKTDITALTD